MFTVDRTPLALAPYLHDTVKMFHLSAQAKGVALTLTLGGGAEDLAVSVDWVKMKTVFRNLLSNAIKFSPAGGAIQVNVTGVPASALEEAHVVVAVTDSGFGLYISKGIVTLHEGEIWAESAGEGKGSTFLVKLPLFLGAVPRLMNSGSVVNLAGWSSGDIGAGARAGVVVRTADNEATNTAGNVAGNVGGDALDSGRAGGGAGKGFELELALTGTAARQPSTAVAVAVADTHAAAALPPPVHLTILVVDDSDMTRKLVARKLQSLGHTCLEADDGLQAVSMVLKSMVAAVPSALATPVPSMMVSAQVSRSRSQSELLFDALAACEGSEGGHMVDVENGGVDGGAGGPGGAGTGRAGGAGGAGGSGGGVVAPRRRGDRSPYSAAQSRHSHQSQQSRQGQQEPHSAVPTPATPVRPAAVVDLVLVDSNMPRMGGLDATFEMRRWGYSGIIVAVSGDDCEEEFLRAGADAFLTKPLKSSCLQVVIDRYFTAGTGGAPQYKQAGRRQSELCVPSLAGGQQAHLSRRPSRHRQASPGMRARVLQLPTHVTDRALESGESLPVLLQRPLPLPTLGERHVRGSASGGQQESLLAPQPQPQPRVAPVSLPFRAPLELGGFSAECRGGQGDRQRSRSQSRSHGHSYSQNQSHSQSHSRTQSQHQHQNLNQSIIQSHDESQSRNRRRSLSQVPRRRGLSDASDGSHDSSLHSSRRSSHPRGLLAGSFGLYDDRLAI